MPRKWARWSAGRAAGGRPGRGSRRAPSPRSVEGGTTWCRLGCEHGEAPRGRGRSALEARGDLVAGVRGPPAADRAGIGIGQHACRASTGLSISISGKTQGDAGRRFPETIDHLPGRNLEGVETDLQPAGSIWLADGCCDDLAGDAGEVAPLWICSSSSSGSGPGAFEVPGQHFGRSLGLRRPGWVELILRNLGCVDVRRSGAGLDRLAIAKAADR